MIHWLFIYLLINSGINTVSGIALFASGFEERSGVFGVFALIFLALASLGAILLFHI